MGYATGEYIKIKIIAQTYKNVKYYKTYVWVSEYFRVPWGLTTARSYANVLNPQVPEGFLQVPEALTQDLQD
jgi:hypothetical protein